MITKRMKVCWIGGPSERICNVAWFIPANSERGSSRNGADSHFGLEFESNVINAFGHNVKLFDNELHDLQLLTIDIKEEPVRFVHPVLLGKPELLFQLMEYDDGAAEKYFDLLEAYSAAL